MRVTATLLLALGGVLTSASLTANNAEACVCSVPVLVSPSDGSTDVPPNAVVIVRADKPVELTGPGGPVDVQLDTLTSQAEGVQIQRATPTAPLAPGQYQVQVNGVLFSTFEVAGDADTVAPAAPLISSAGASFTPRACYSSCGGDSYTEVSLAVDNSDEAAYYDVVLESGDGAGYERTLLAQSLDDIHTLGGAECGTSPPPMDAGSTWQITLVAHDVSDNASEPATASFVVDECAEVACGVGVPGTCDPPNGSSGSSAGGCTTSQDPSWATATLLLLLGMALRWGRMP